MTVRLLAAPHTNPNSKSCITGSVVEASMLHVLSYCIKWPEVQHSTGILWSTAVSAGTRIIALPQSFFQELYNGVSREPIISSPKDCSHPS